MKTFLGIPLYNKMTDADVVEQVRKNLKKSRRYAWIPMIVFVCLACYIFIYYVVIKDIVGNMPDDDVRKFAWSGLLFGMILGIVLGNLLMNAMIAFFTTFDILQFNRKDKLLIKYHDLLAQVAAERQTCDESFSAYPEGLENTPSGPAEQ